MNSQDNGGGGSNSPEVKYAFIFVVLLGVAFLMWYVMSGERNVNVTLPDQVKISEEDAAALDPNILKIETDGVGDYFVHAHSGQVLYTSDADCRGACLDVWTPYEAIDRVALGQIFTEVREDTGAIQYTWKGARLYTYTLDSFGNILGDGQGGVWHIARP